MRATGVAASILWRGAGASPAGPRVRQDASLAGVHCRHVPGGLVRRESTVTRDGATAYTIAVEALDCKYEVK